MTNPAERLLAAMANAQADAMFTRLAAGDSPTMGEGQLARDVQLAPWLAALADPIETLNPDLRICAHEWWLEPGDGPIPGIYHVSAWRPDMIVCTPCAKAGRLIEGMPPEEEWRCDRCGRDSPGCLKPSCTKLPNPRLGAVLLWYSLCPACHADQIRFLGLPE